MTEARIIRNLRILSLPSSSLSCSRAGKRGKPRVCGAGAREVGLQGLRTRRRAKETWGVSVTRFFQG